jgi:hypothetical protein
MPGYTKLDNDTELNVILALPSALQGPFLFLLSRQNLDRSATHYGEVMAAISRGHTQTLEALRALEARGLIRGENGRYSVVKSGQEPGRESDQKPGRKPSRETNRKSDRKPGMDNSKNTVQHEENRSPELKELKELKKETVFTLNPPTVEASEQMESEPLQDDFQKLEEFITALPRDRRGQWRQLALLPGAHRPMLEVLSRGHDLAFAFVRVANLVKARDDSRVSMLIELAKNLEQHPESLVLDTLTKASADSIVSERAWVHYRAWLLEATATETQKPDPNLEPEQMPTLAELLTSTALTGNWSKS